MIAASILAACALLAPLSALPVAADDPDLVVLENGKEVECRVLREGDDVVLVRIGSRTREIPRDEIASIDSVERSLREFLRRFDELEDRGADGLAALATYCEENGLPAEARNLWIQILTIDPENEQAWTKLGGSYSKRRGWRLKVRGRFYTLEQLRERASDWRNAMEIPTAHFLLKTDIEPARALDVALNLERAFVTYYDVLGEVLDLQVFDQIPEVHIFKDPEDYPAPRTAGQDAWFAAGPNIVYVNGAAPDVAREAVFQLTHALALSSFRRTIGGSGSIAPWVQRALAESFAAAYRSADGVATWDFGPPIRTYFEAHAADESPLTIKRLLGASYGAYTNGSDAPRYVAQGYTLLHFLLHAKDGTYRDGLGEYLRSSFKGQSAATHLQRALDVDLDDVEEEWKAYVDEVAAS